MSAWNPIIVGTSLNLRIPRGHEASEFTLSGDVAKSQLRFKPDIVCNYEDMEGCISDEYDRQMNPEYVRVAATDDRQGRGVSCWVKREYTVEKIYSMNTPHFMHVRIRNNDGIELDLMVMRILVSDSGVADYIDRHAQWEKAMGYVDSLGKGKNIVLVGDWNHGVIADIESYIGKSRQYYNYQMIEKSLSDRDIKLVPMIGYSFKNYMRIDHLAVSPSVMAVNARYENVYGTDVTEIGIPDHSYIVSELRMCG